MGVANLNCILQKKCTDSIYDITFSDLKNKVIAVDISIYLYKFNYAGNLLDGLYQFIYFFNKYNITPLFVFDGKAPDSKKQVILQRKKDREDAKKKCEILEKQLKTASKDLKEIILDELNICKKRATGLPRNAYEIAKECITAAGLTYYDAISEADMLCVKLVQENIAWACLSEDMDMFVYGCPYVLRNMNLYKNTLQLYDYGKILKTFNINSDYFRVLCSVSGTDYTPQYIKIGLQNAMKIFNYSKCKEDFINNLIVKWSYLSKYLNKINEIANMFDLSNVNVYDLGKKFESKCLKFSNEYIIYLENNNYIFTKNIKNKYKKV